jgi:hypothetical protein
MHISLIVEPPRLNDHPDFDAPDPGTHNPDCSSITDAELAQTIDGLWPNSNGQANINYVFSLPAFYWFGSPDASLFHLRNVDADVAALFQETVRGVIAQIMQRNNGIFTFKEISRSFNTDYNPYFRGIFYVQAASVAQFAEIDAGAFTVLRYDNNGYIKQGMIYLPTDLEIYNDTNNIYQPDWIEYAISHESEHAFACEHLQDYPDILAKLQNIVDGVFCAVMDYPSIIGTNISNCMQNCTPAFAIYPASLDVRTIRQAYIQNQYNHGYDKTSYYASNAFDFFLFFSLIASVYAVVAELAYFAAQRGKISFIDRKSIYTILNFTLTGLFIAMDAPVEIPISLGLSMGLQIIPEKILNKSIYFRDGSCGKIFLNTKFPLYVAATVSSASEGHLPLPLFLNFLSNNAGMLFGSVIGILLEIFLKKFLPPTLVIEEGLEMAEVAENRDQQVVVIAAGPAEEKSEPVVSRAADVREDSGNPLTPVFNRFPANDQKSYQHSFFRSASFDKTKKATLPANKRRANSF